MPAGDPLFSIPESTVMTFEEDYNRIQSKVKVLKISGFLTEKGDAGRVAVFGLFVSIVVQNRTVARASRQKIRKAYAEFTKRRQAGCMGA
jgi:hypothetical protein